MSEPPNKQLMKQTKQQQNRKEKKRKYDLSVCTYECVYVCVCDTYLLASVSTTWLTKKQQHRYIYIIVVCLYMCAVCLFVCLRKSWSRRLVSARIGGERKPRCACGVSDWNLSSRARSTWAFPMLKDILKKEVGKINKSKTKIETQKNTNWPIFSWL